MTGLLFYKTIPSSKVSMSECVHMSACVYTLRVILIKATTSWPVSSH